MGGGIKDQNVSADAGLDNLKLALFRNGEKNGFFWKDDFILAAGNNTWYGAGTPWTLATTGTGGTALGLAGHGGLAQLLTTGGGAGTIVLTGLPLVDLDKRPKFIILFRTPTTLAGVVSSQIGIYKDANEYAVLDFDIASGAAFRFLHAAGGAGATVVSVVPIVAATWYAAVFTVGASVGTGSAKRFPVDCKLYGPSSPTPAAIGGGLITDDDTHVIRVFLSSAVAHNMDLDLAAIAANR